MLALNWPISFDQPAWLWLLLAIPVLVLISLRSLAGLERGRRFTALLMRSLVIAALAIALARVQIVRRDKHVAVMFVLDRSKSIPEPQRLAAEKFIKEMAKHADRDDRIGVIGFDGEADVDLIPSRGGFDVQSLGLPIDPDRTNIAAGMRLALAAFPEGFGRRIVLVSDGNQNDGDLDEETAAANANGVAVDVLPLQYEHQSEVLFDRISVPAHASKDTKIPVRMIIKSRQPTRVKVELFHNDQEVPLQDNILELSGGMRPDPFTVPLELNGGGVHRFDARITPLDPGADAIPENNRATALTFVEEQGGVLILTQAGSNDDKPLYDALKREQVQVEMKGVNEFNADPESLEQYSVVILANIAADQFNEEQHKALVNYVRHYGGGLIMTGGDEGFGAGGWIGKPIEEVSPVSFEVKHKKILPRGALAIVMHSCEIPRGNEWGVKVAVAALQTISSLDYFGVIDYSYKRGGPDWEVPLQQAVNKPAIIDKINNLSNGDMNDFDSLMKIAVRDLLKLDAAQRHVIIISDGDPGPPTAATIKDYTDHGITVSTVAIGYGFHVMEPTLRKIATDCSGRFYACRNPNLLPQIFVKEAKVVKRPLIEEKPFRPQLTGFSQVTLGISGSEIPSLGGVVLTTPKADISMPLTHGADKDPVLAYWNYEMGKMAVFTSGWWPKWGDQWANWEKFGKFWAQLVRWAMRQKGSADFDIASRVEGNRGHVTIEALNKDASYLNFLKITGVLVTPSMAEIPLDNAIRQTGPGQYEVEFPIHDHGNYHIYMKYRDPKGELGPINTGVSVLYSPEYRELSANIPLLQDAAHKTAGRMLDFSTDVKKLFSRDLPATISRQPAWRWVVTWLLIPLFILDVASRRLASWLAMSIYVELAILVCGFASMYAVGARGWGYLGVVLLAEIVGWVIRHRSIGPALAWVSGSAIARTAESSQQSLSQLRGVREKVRDDLKAQASDAKSQKETISVEKPADKTARFDVGDKQASQPAGDLTQAVGGADPNALAAEDKTRRESAQQARDKVSAGGDLASRLKKAKQRAQDEIKDRTDEEKK